MLSSQEDTLKKARHHARLEKARQRLEEHNRKIDILLLDAAKTLVCLLEDNEYIILRIKKYTIEITEAELVYLKSQPIMRNEVLKKLITIFEEVQKIQSITTIISTNEQFFNTMTFIHDLTLRDYQNQNNPDIMMLLIKNKMAPITMSELTLKSNNFEYSDDALKRIKKTQMFFRSKQRAKLHQEIFDRKAVNQIDLPANIKMNSKLIGIILELTAVNAVIRNTQYHWTTYQNLKSIIRNQYFYGNKTLVEKQLFFRKNALIPQDVKNGDGNVICFCPFMVDYDAFYNVRIKKIKEGTVRLSLDINKIESIAGYNQFFKLVDFCSPKCDYLVHINNDMSIKISKCEYKEFTITITLKGESKAINLLDDNLQSKHNIIFYGNLSGINRFCLLSIFNLISKSNDAQFEEKFISYLISLDNNEIKKILIIFAQSITVFAEYNFNSTLKNTVNLIQTIHFYNTSQTLELDTLSKTDYNKAMQLLLNDQQPLNICSVKKETLIATLENDSGFELYGSTIVPKDRYVNFGVRDLKQEHASIYDRGEYIETRIDRLHGTTEYKSSFAL